MKIRRIGALLASVPLSILAAGAAATEYVAWTFSFNPRLGHPLGSIGTLQVYPPWEVFHWIPDIRSAFPSIAHTAGFIVLAAAVPPIMIIGFMSRRKPLTVKEFGADAWGTRDDAIKAGILSAKNTPPRGTVLGKWGEGKRRRILSYDGSEHQLVIGASRAGKGVGHVIPTLLCWPESMFVYDPKEECYDIVGAFRSRFSHVFYVNPTSLESAHYNPLMEVRRGLNELSDVQNVVAGLINSVAEKPGSWDFFEKASFLLLSAITLHVLYSAPDDKKNLAHVRAKLFDLDRTMIEMDRTHHRHRPDRTKPDGLARDEAGELIPETVPEIGLIAPLYLKMSSRQRDGVHSTAINALTMFSDDILAEVTSRSDFRMGDLMCADRPVTMFLQLPASDQPRLRPFIRMCISQFSLCQLRYIDRDFTGRKKKHKCLTLIDEFPSLGRLDLFVSNLKQMAGYGVKAHLIVQSLKDIMDTYGQHATIVDNMHISVAFAGADSESNKAISAMTGPAREYRESRSESARGFSTQVSTSYSEADRPLLDPGQVRQLSYDKQLVFVTGTKPFMTPKLRYYEDPLLAPRATDIRKGHRGPDQGKHLDVPFPDAKHGDWIGVEAVYFHEVTDEELAALRDETGGASTPRKGDPAEAVRPAEDLAAQSAAEEDMAAAIAAMAANATFEGDGDMEESE